MKAFDEFKEEIVRELGYCSALFMSRECKGTEMVMPTKELKEIADRIGLYFFKHQSDLEKRLKQSEINEHFLLSCVNNANNELPHSILGTWQDRAKGLAAAIKKLIAEMNLRQVK